jgi:hypothetical protein
MTTLFNRGYVPGALAHWSTDDLTGGYIYDYSGNGLHLNNPNGTSVYVGYDKQGSRQELDHGFNEFRDPLSIRVKVANKDDGSDLFDTYLTLRKCKRVAGNSGYHNLAESYLLINNANFDRSNTTIWSAKARGTLYKASSPFSWHITELNRFDLYYWANTGYEGKALIGGYPNSFSPCQYINAIFSYPTNKSKSDLSKFYKWSGDYEAELIYNGDFNDSLSANIWYHAWQTYLTFTNGKANYIGTTGQTGCIRQFLFGLYIIGVKFKLSCIISGADPNARVLFSGNGTVQFQEWIDSGFRNFNNGTYSEIVTCANNEDEYFELQMSNVAEGGSQCSFDNISLKIEE